MSFSVKSTGSVYEGEKLQFEITRSTPIGGEIVYFASGVYNRTTQDDCCAERTAHSGNPADYKSTSGGLWFAPGVTKRYVYVQTYADNVKDEGEYDSSRNGYYEHIYMSVSSSRLDPASTPLGSTTGKVYEGALNKARLYVGNANTVREGTASRFLVSRTGIVNTAVSVRVTTKSGSAVNNFDYKGFSRNLYFKAYEKFKFVYVPTIHDWTDNESIEKYNFGISGASANAVVEKKWGTGAIVNVNRPKSTLFVSEAVQVKEGGYSRFKITRSGAISSTVNYRVTSRNGSALNGSDYTGYAKNLQFKPNQTYQFLHVKTLKDANHNELREKFNFGISSVSVNAKIGKKWGTGTIANKLPPSNFYITGPTGAVLEGEGLWFTITRTGDLSQAGYVSYVTQDVTANNFADYVGTFLPARVNFAANQTSKKILISTVRDNRDPEGTEKFNVKLFNASDNALIKKNTATGSIENISYVWVRDTIFEQKDVSFNMAGENFNLIAPKHIGISKYANLDVKNWNVDFSVSAAVKGSLDVGLNLGFNMGSISGKSKMNTEVLVAVPKITAGKRFVIDTSKWTYKAVSGAGFTVDRSEWGGNFKFMCKGVIQASVKLAMSAFGAEFSKSAALTVDPNIELDFLGYSLDKTIGDLSIKLKHNQLEIEHLDWGAKLSFNLPNLSAVESHVKNGQFEASRDADPAIAALEADLIKAGIAIAATIAKTNPPVGATLEVLKSLNTEMSLSTSDLPSGWLTDLLPDITATLKSKALGLTPSISVGLNENFELNAPKNKSEIDLILVFNGKQQKKKMGDQFTFFAPADKSADSLQIIYNYATNINATRTVGAKMGILAEAGRFETDFTYNGKKYEPLSLNMGPIFTQELDVAIKGASKTFNYNDNVMYADKQVVGMSYV